MDKKTKIVLLNFAIFKVFFIYVLVSNWRVSGGDIAIIFFTIAFLLLHVFIISPIFALIFDSKHKLKSYFLGLMGAMAAMVSSLVVFSIISYSFVAEFEKNNPYRNSEYSEQDSTTYFKAVHSNNAYDFSNINPKTIRKVNIWGHDFKYLPEEVLNIDSLETLWLMGLKNLELTHTLSNLKNPSLIRDLRVGDSNLKIIPEEILFLENLEALRIQSNPDLNPTEVFEIISKLPNLKYLVISNNQWTYLPSQIYGMKSLEVLRADNNNLSYLPHEMSSLENLRKVYLRNNSLGVSIYEVLDITKIEIVVD